MRRVLSQPYFVVTRCLQEGKRAGKIWGSVSVLGAHIPKFLFLENLTFILLLALDSNNLSLRVDLDGGMFVFLRISDRWISYVHIPHFAIS